MMEKSSYQLLCPLLGGCLMAMALSLVTAYTPQDGSMDGATEAYTIEESGYDVTLSNGLSWDQANPQALPDPPWGSTSEYMMGRICTSVILLESDGTIDSESEDWTSKEKKRIRNEVEEGLGWWVGRAGKYDIPIAWRYNYYYIENPINTGYEPIRRPHTDDHLWIQEAMTKLGFTNYGTASENVRDYNNHIRDSCGSDWAYTAFVVDDSHDKDDQFSDDWSAYANPGGPRTVLTRGNGNWFWWQFSRVFAHETGHIFWAMDEYASSGCSPTDSRGYLNGINSNCENGGSGKNNIMNNNWVLGKSPRSETRVQIGWRDSDGDKIPDIMDTYPETTLNPYSPDPSWDTTPTYTGFVKDIPLENKNPSGVGEDISINDVYALFNVDGGPYINWASPSDGRWDGAIEDFTFTTPVLSPGVHTICVRGLNMVSHWEHSASCDTLTVADTIPPVANAGADQTVDEGSPVTLNGGASSDNIGIVSYEWDFDASDGVSFSPPDATGVSPTHTYGDNGIYIVTLQVKDTWGNSDTDTMTVTVRNVAPSLTAESNKAVLEGSSVAVAATFSDAGWLDTHTADIDWGEGTISSGVVIEENVKPDATGSVSGSHIYGDNGVFTVTIRLCDDDGACVSDTLTVTVRNLAPAVISSPATATINEGQTVSFTGSATDPGSDDLTFKWSWDYRSTCDSTKTYLNDPMVGPDPYPSPTFNPRNVAESQACQYGDNGVFTVTLIVTDDDGASTTVTSTITVINVAPAVDPLPDVTFDEGQTVSFTGHATDPGSDDMTFSWFWDYRSTCDITTIYLNDPLTGSDPSPSPTNNPRDVAEFQACQYGDNGVFTATLTVTDDDGASTTVTSTLTVVNVAPAVDPLPDITVSEWQDIALVGHATDPGSDDMTFSWSWDYRSICDTTTTYLNDPLVGPDPSPSPTNNPRDIIENPDCPYGDNGVYTISLTVTDDDGASTTVSMTLTMEYVDPYIDLDYEIYVLADVTLRAAGEKWHDVELTLYEDGTATASASVVRYPGSPDDQSVTLTGVRIDIRNCSISGVARYTPMDDPINGQITGATPGWVILTLEDGAEIWLNHTFNVNHPETWTWTVSDFCPHIDLLNLPIYLEFTASDPGSDDLTFTYQWGDSTPDTVATYYNNGVNPDPYPSPDVNPISLTHTAVHTYTSYGTYAITVEVKDDDGGVSYVTFSLTI
ncbi:MAG: PKD domain-containing protein [Methanobacteriota archaeon]|nr:MAG: PKD domain-containing protein [Euryarchaeota archaeon]